MKKGFGKKIVILGISLILGLVQVNAESCDLSLGEDTDNGRLQYSSNCHLEAYCVGYGQERVDNLEQCEIMRIESESLNNVYNSAPDLSAKLAGIRTWAEINGLANYKDASHKMEAVYDAMDAAGKAAYEEAKKKSRDAKLSPIDGSVSNAFIFSLQSSQKVGTDGFTAVIYAKPTTTITGNVSFMVSVNGGTSRTVDSSKSGDGYIINISGNLIECEGATVNIGAYSDGAGTGYSGFDYTVPEIKPTPGIDVSFPFYYAKCEGRQNYVLFTQEEWVVQKLISGSKGKPGKKYHLPAKDGSGRTLVGTGTVSIPDPECKCSGATNLEGGCDIKNNTNYFVKDSEDIRKCITSGKYKKYCGDGDIKKENDNNASSDKRNVNLSISGGSTSVKLAENNYCSVYCRESVDYKFPGFITAKNGKYFVLRDGWSEETPNGENIKFAGERTCYTTAIDRSKFGIDMKTAQEEIVTKYNDYLKKKATKESIEGATSEDETYCTASSCDATTGKEVAGTGATRKKYTGKKVNYVQYDCKFDTKVGEMKYCTPKNESVQINWTDEVEEGSSSSCSKSGSATTCGAISREVTIQVKLADEGLSGKLTFTPGWSKMTKAIQEYKSCFEWNNNYCFDPKINFSYDEVYNSMMQGELKGTVAEEGKNSQFSTSIIDSVILNGTTYNPKKIDYLYIKDNSTTAPEKQYSILDDNNLYVAKSVKKSKTFADSTNEIYTYHPNGTISLDGGPNKVSLGKVFPVALENESDEEVYLRNYYLDISNVGMGGNDGDITISDDGSCKTSANRLMGEGCSLYNTETKGNVGQTEYTCQYGVKCDQCTVDCECDPIHDPNYKYCYVEDKVCKWKIPPCEECPDCKVECIGCIWNRGNTSYTYKQVSVSDLFPNSDSTIPNATDVGYNWNTSNDVNKNSEKAKDTIKEINDKKQEVYKQAEYSYKLTPKTMADIRTYNKAANCESTDCSSLYGRVDSRLLVDGKVTSGGYSNETLKCTNGTNCTSSFLDGLKKIGGIEIARNTKWYPYENGTSWK